MTFKQILDKCSKVMPSYNKEYLDTDSFETFCKGTRELDARRWHLNPYWSNNEAALFFTEGYFDLHYNKKIHELVVTGTEKLKKETDNEYFKRGGAIAYVEQQDEGVPKLLQLKRSYEKDDPKTRNCANLLASTFYEVNNGKLSISPQRQARIDRYIRDAERHCAGVLAASWWVSNLIFDDQKTVTGISFFSRGYYLILRSVKSSAAMEGTKTVITALNAIPEKIYPILRNAIPAGIEMMFPTAILKGFEQLRELIPEVPVEPVEAANTENA